MHAVRYQPPMTRQDRQRRPSGHHHQVTDELLERLEELLVERGWWAKDLAKDMTDRGYPVDEATVSNIRRRKFPTSRFVAPMCELYGWPLPPIASVPEELQEWWEFGQKMRAENPKMYRAELRKYRELLGEEGNEEDSD